MLNANSSPNLYLPEISRTRQTIRTLRHPIKHDPTQACQSKLLITYELASPRTHTALIGRACQAWSFLRVMVVLASLRAPGALAHTFVIRTHPLRSFRACPRLKSSTHDSTDDFVAGLSWDLETTGLDTKTAEIVQLAIVCVNSERNAEFSRLVLPEGEINAHAARVHGWTKSKLLESGAVPFPVAWRECEDWLKLSFNDTRPLVWAAHNGKRFDQPILERCVQDATGSSSAALSGARAVHVDTLTMARSTLPGRSGTGSYTLGRLHSDAGAGIIADAHDALSDARALGTVWRWLVAFQLTGQNDRHDFQRYLQSLVHGPKPLLEAPAGARRHALRTASSTRDKAKPTLRDARPELKDEASVINFPGVGKKIESRLRLKGICSVADLKKVWRKCGGNQKGVGTWLSKSMPGIQPVALFKLAKELKQVMDRDRAAGADVE